MIFLPLLYIFFFSFKLTTGSVKIHNGLHVNPTNSMVDLKKRCIKNVLKKNKNEKRSP